MALSEEHKAKMAEGRERAKEARRLRLELAAQRQDESAPGPVEPVPVMPAMEGDEQISASPAEDEPRSEGASAPYEIFLASLSDETRELLDEAELRDAFDAATREASAEKRKKLKAQAAVKAKDQARAVAGLLPAEELAHREFVAKNLRKVRFTPILPFINDQRGLNTEGIVLDGKPFYHGMEAEMTYGQWRDMISIIWNNRQQELNFKGEGRLSSLRRDMNERGGVSFVRS